VLLHRGSSTEIGPYTPPYHFPVPITTPVLKTSKPTKDVPTLRH
jgi:hypothetical protein